MDGFRVTLLSIPTRSMWSTDDGSRMPKLFDGICNGRCSIIFLICSVIQSRFDFLQEWWASIKMAWRALRRRFQSLSVCLYAFFLLPQLHYYCTFIHYYEIESDNSNENVTNNHNKGSEEEQKQKHDNTLVLENHRLKRNHTLCAP